MRICGEVTVLYSVVLEARLIVKRSISESNGSIELIATISVWLSYSLDSVTGACFMSLRNIDTVKEWGF